MNRPGKFVLTPYVSSSKASPVYFPLSSLQTFSNPIITSCSTSPDPWVTYHEGYYYFCLALHRVIWVWRSSTLSGLDRGQKVKVWRAPMHAANSKQIWAPELHFLNDRWYIYYAASNGNNANHRMYVLESEGADALGRYRERGKITDPSDRWAIDGTVLQHTDGRLYFIWSGWPSTANGLQNLYIAPMANPWTVYGPRVMLSTPRYSWEGWINEGPQVLQKDGKLFIVYSANASWKAEYCLGLLTFSGGDLLNRANWHKKATPVFSQYSTSSGGTYSVGHCSFTLSSDGREDWLLYHGKDNPDKGWVKRQTRAQKFGWHSDGSPNFGQPALTGQPVALPSGELALAGGLVVNTLNRAGISSLKRKARTSQKTS